MFLATTHAPQLLSPERYYSAEHLAVEIERLFLPAWHGVGSLAELPREGSFFTRRLLDRPVVVWRTPDGPQAFLNVCPHRFSQVTSATCGQASRLRCQYHGWEFGPSGKALKIPDAQSFKPLGGDDELGLERLDTVVCGQLVFVRLEDGPAFAKQFGEQATVLERLFDAERREVFRMTEEVGANWKLVAENAVESYHVGCVHAASFTAMPSAETCRHELGERRSSFITDFPSQAPALLRAGERLVHRMLGTPYVERYEHIHFYPHLFAATSKMFSMVMSVEPLSPVRTRLHLRLFGDLGPRRGLAARAAFWIASQFAKRETAKVIREDLAVLPAIQAGVQTPQLPRGGLISIREERIHHFQRWLNDALAN